jgi:hypothetical protein
VSEGQSWRLADLNFVSTGDGTERATLDGVEVIRENGRYWIMTLNGPQFDIDEREVDAALNDLFLKKRQQQEQSSQNEPSRENDRDERRRSVET